MIDHERKNVRILCTRNSARSQMAEALLRAKAGDRFDVYGAGLRPDQVHPLVPAVMNEIDIDVSGQWSEDVKDYLGRLVAHYLIVVCADAEEHCPRMFPGVGERLFGPFDDPASVDSGNEDALAIFRRVRDQIAARLDQWLEIVGTEV
jgi:arsenate reductase